MPTMAGRVFSSIGRVVRALPSTSRGRRDHGGLVIRGGYVLSMDPAAGELPAADVHVADGKIIAVGEGTAGLRIPAVLSQRR